MTLTPFSPAQIAALEQGKVLVNVVGGDPLQLRASADCVQLRWGSGTWREHHQYSDVFQILFHADQFKIVEAK